MQYRKELRKELIINRIFINNVSQCNNANGLDISEHSSRDLQGLAGCQCMN